ncbi:putative Hemerythrin-like metal-binding protein [Syntrophobacter sp. SbD1]|nr:putative Hemerythrin-like metal-binding protein [Syntrophobacter sp. SbD1]
MEWKDSYNVGIKDLDAQHRGLLDLINRIGDLADMFAPSNPVVFGALNEMIRYADNHFRTEERYLEKYGYPKYLEQREEHEAFVEKTFEMAGDLEKENGLTLGAIILFLEDWYADHILGKDRSYAQCLATKMAGQADVDSTSVGVEASRLNK